MSDPAIVQYLGFDAKALVRTYIFNVREAGAEREFTLNIANQSFVSHRARYQDAPAICAVRLQAELAAHANHPLETHYVITGAELDNHRGSRLPKNGRRAKEDF
jgi:hypothetical protein